jgi:hypothetical protein
MDEWDGSWTAWDELMTERTIKTWLEFEEWVKARRQARDEAIDTYIGRKRNGRAGSPTPDQSGDEAGS